MRIHPKSKVQEQDWAVFDPVVCSLIFDTLASQGVTLTGAVSQAEGRLLRAYG
jgi:hypothetical protein